MKILKISIASLIIFSCSNTEENESSNNGKGIVQNENAETISYDGQEREYILYVPSSIDESSPVPLMLNFHGGGGNASGQIYVYNAYSIMISFYDTTVIPCGKSK